MGYSGMKGRVYVADQHCPSYTGDYWANFNEYEMDGTQEAVLAAEKWPDEVTNWTMVESAQKREYGHDKSAGWQDVVYGTRRLEVTLTCVAHDQGANPTKYHSGQILYLVLYPFSASCGAEFRGYAGVDRVSYEVDIDRGSPVGYTMSLSSKGPWLGIPGSNAEWGGFECDCDTSGQSGQLI